MTRQPLRAAGRAARPLALALARRGARLGGHAHLSQLRLLLPPGLGPASCSTGSTPSFEAYAAPTQHPLYLALGARARRWSSARARTARSCSSACSRTPRSCSAPTGSARRCSGAGAARWRRCSSPRARRSCSTPRAAYVDAPFLALVVWAGVLEAERRDRGVAPWRAARRSPGCCGPRPGCWRACWLWLLPRRTARALSRPRSRSCRRRAAALGARRPGRHRRPAALAARHVASSPTTSAASAGSTHVPGLVRVASSARPCARRSRCWRRSASCSPWRLLGWRALRVPLALFAAGVDHVRRHRRARPLDPAALPDRPGRRAVPVRRLRAARLHRRCARRAAAPALGAGVGGRRRGRRGRPGRSSRRR